MEGGKCSRPIKIVAPVLLKAGWGLPALVPVGEKGVIDVFRCHFVRRALAQPDEVSPCG